MTEIQTIERAVATLRALKPRLRGLSELSVEVSYATLQAFPGSDTLILPERGVGWGVSRQLAELDLHLDADLPDGSVVTRREIERDKLCSNPAAELIDWWLEDGLLRRTDQPDVFVTASPRSDGGGWPEPVPKLPFGRAARRARPRLHANAGGLVTVRRRRTWHA
jgi:hypothetical protein